MTAMPWVLILIVGLILVLAVLIFSLYKHRKKNYRPDYRGLFILGVIFLFLGILMSLSVFWILGVIYMIVGVVHKDQWKKNQRTWNKMKKNERKVFMGIIIALLLFFVVGIGTYLFITAQTGITNFEECIAAGNPAMESYPRQCRDPISDQTFVEFIDGNSFLTGSVINENPQEKKSATIKIIK